MKDLQTAIDKLTDKITALEAELHIAQESLAEIKPINYTAIEQWVKEEFAPEFKTNIEESIKESIEESIDEKLNESTKAIAEGVQNWVTNEFAPVVEGWVTNEFAPVVEGWVTNEFGTVVEGWVTNEFGTELEEKINENINEFINEQKVGRLEEIDALLESIEDKTDVEKIVTENREASKYKGIYVVENMPAEYTASWQLINEEKQEEIIRSSKMYDFTKEGVLESFWANVDFTNNPKQENQIVDVVESYHSNIASQMKRFGKW